MKTIKHLAIVVIFSISVTTSLANELEAILTGINDNRYLTIKPENTKPKQGGGQFSMNVHIRGDKINDIIFLCPAIIEMVEIDGRDLSNKPSSSRLAWSTKPAEIRSNKTISIDTGGSHRGSKRSDQTLRFSGYVDLHMRNDSSKVVTDDGISKLKAGFIKNLLLKEHDIQIGYILKDADTSLINKFFSDVENKFSVTLRKGYNTDVDDDINFYISDKNNEIIYIELLDKDKKAIKRGGGSMTSLNNGCVIGRSYRKFEDAKFINIYLKSHTTLKRIAFDFTEDLP